MSDTPGNNWRQAGAFETGWQAADVLATGTNFVVNAGTLEFAPIASGHLIANAGTGTAEPGDTTLTALLDRVIGNTQNEILVRGTSAWAAGSFDSNFSINSGTVALAATGAKTLFGNSGTGTAEPHGTIAIGSGITLTAAGTLSNAGAISVAAGSGLSGGTITNGGTGTIALGTIAAISLMGNAGTVAAVPGAVAIGGGLSLSAAGTLSNTGILSLVAGSNITISGGNTIASTASGGVGTIVAGAGLTGGTITSSGTIALDPLGNSLAINSGTIDTDYTPVYFSADFTLAATDRGKSYVDNGTGTVDLIVTLPTFAAGTKLATDFQNNSSTHVTRLRPATGVTIDGVPTADGLVAHYTSTRLALDNTGTNYVAQATNCWWQPGNYVSALGAGIQIINNGTFNTNGTLAVNLTAGSGISITGTNAVTIAATGGMSSNVLFDMSAGVPSLASFTQFGTATITENAGKAIIMTVPAGTRNLNGITKAAPATPYRLAMLMQLYIPNISFAAFSFGFSDGTKYSTVTLSAGSGTFQFEHWTNSTTRFANVATANQTPVGPGNITSYAWFGIENNGTVVSFEYSPDGANWIVFQKETIAGGFLANYNTAYVGILPDAGIPAGFSIIADLRVWDVNGLTRKVG